MDNSMYERKNRITEALDIRQMKQTELSEKTGIRKGTINNWAKQRYQPRQKSLYILAQALNVSEMWLAGYDAPMEIPEERIRMDTLAKAINIVRKDARLSDMVIDIAKLKEPQLTTAQNIISELAKLSQLNQQACQE